MMKLQETPRWMQVVVAVGLVGSVVASFWPGRPAVVTYAPLVAFALGGLLVYLVVVGRPNLRRATAALGRRVRSMAGRWWAAVVLPSALLALAFPGVLLAITAPLAAESVSQGRSYRDWSVPWRADPVTVYWLKQVPPTDPLTGHCLMYLGQANGVVVLYDVELHRSVRIAGSEVILLIDTSSKSCQRS